MNIDHDEHGSVDVDALMAVHNEKVQKKMEMSARILRIMTIMSLVSASTLM